MTVDREYLHFVDTHLIDHARESLPHIEHIGVPTVFVSTTVDVRMVLQQKRAAIAAHASQVQSSSSVMRLSDEFVSRGLRLRVVRASRPARRDRNPHRPTDPRVALPYLLVDGAGGAPGTPNELRRCTGLRRSRCPRRARPPDLLPTRSLAGARPPARPPRWLDVTTAAACADGRKTLTRSTGTGTSAKVRIRLLAGNGFGGRMHRDHRPSMTDAAEAGTACASFSGCRRHTDDRDHLTLRE